MKLSHIHIAAASLAIAIAASAPARAQTAPAIMAPRPPQPAIPNEFKDPDTGARIVHLSRFPNDSSGVIYFHQPSFTPDNRFALVRELDLKAGHAAGYMYAWDFQTQQITKLTDRLTHNQGFAPASGNLYYASDNDHAIYVTNIHTKETKKIFDLPADLAATTYMAINNDETTLASVAQLRKDVEAVPAATRPNQGSAFDQTFARHELNILFTLDLKTGQYKELQRINTWLGHPQFCPTDAHLMMYCHEGPWPLVDRIWTIRTEDGAQPQLVHKRTAPPEQEEIAGHEFWSTDGKEIWFDHNFRKVPGRTYLTSKNMATEAETMHKLAANMSSLHFVQSPDSKFFLCDGGAGNQDMFILIPEGDSFKRIKICSMAKNDYKVAEPNQHLSSDQHWVIFTATFFGSPQAWALEMPKDYWRNVN